MSVEAKEKTEISVEFLKLKHDEITSDLKNIRADILELNKHNALPFWKKGGFRGGASAVFICFGVWILFPFITEEPSLWQWTHENIFRTHTALRSSIASEEERKSIIAVNGTTSDEHTPNEFHSTLDTMMLKRVKEGQSHILYGSHEFTSLNVSLSPMSCYMAQDERLLKLLNVEREDIEKSCWEEIKNGVGGGVSKELLHKTMAKAFIQSSLTIPFKARRDDKATLLFYVYSYPLETKPHKYLTYSVNDEDPVAMPLPQRELNYSTVEISLSSDESAPQSISISLNSDGHEFVQQETNDLNPVIKIDAMLVISKRSENSKTPSMVAQ